jgi:general secretion pathway protein I
MKSRGFTLLEVLVALAILAIGLGAALRAAQGSVTGFEQTRARLLADWVAADRLAELRARRVWPEPGITEGDSDEDGQRFHWRQKVGPTPNAGFRRVAVEVADKDGVVLGEVVGLFWRRDGR